MAVPLRVFGVGVDLDLIDGGPPESDRSPLGVGRGGLLGRPSDLAFVRRDIGSDALPDMPNELSDGSGQ
jgi:hypothetical protein